MRVSFCVHMCTIVIKFYGKVRTCTYIEGDNNGAEKESIVMRVVVVFVGDLMRNPRAE